MPKSIPNVRSEFLREPNLLIPGKKPVGLVKINWTHSFSKDCSAFFCPTPQNRSDLVSGNQPDVWAGAGWEAIQQEFGWRTSADGHYMQYPYVPGYSLNGDFTLLWRGYIYGEVGGSMGFLSNRVDATATGVWYLSSSGSAGSDEAFFVLRNTDFTEVLKTDNSWPSVHPELYTLVVTQKNSGASWKMYNQYGFELYTETDTETTQFPFTSLENPLIINELSAAGTSSIDAIFMCGGIFQRAFSDDEVMSLINDPYQLLISA